MPKNIVLCCDGTANEFAKDNTNVVKLYATLEQNPAAQITYYHPGLGTMEPAGALTPWRRKTTKVLGLALGYGLSNDVRDAYVFLMNHFEPDARVFLFGFSRGAYTARAVAALLHMYGLLRPGNEPLVPYAIRMMMGIERGRDQKDDPEAQQKVQDYFALAGQFKATMSRECKPWFVGVWDTVSSVGWVANPLKLPYISTNPDIQIGRHAIAIDERRAFFRSHLWRPSADPGQSGPKDLKQVWFPGVHCDVGGGYPEAESGLSKIALKWMLDEAQAAQLLVNPGKRAEILGERGGQSVAPNAKGMMHESLKAWWHLAEYVPKKHYDYATGKEQRRMNRHRRRTIPDGSVVHSAVLARGDDYRKLLPQNITILEEAAV